MFCVERLWAVIGEAGRVSGRSVHVFQCRPLRGRIASFPDFQYGCSAGPASSGSLTQRNGVPRAAGVHGKPQKGNAADGGCAEVGEKEPG